MFVVKAAIILAVGSWDLADVCVCNICLPISLLTLLRLGLRHSVHIDYAFVCLLY